MEESDSAPPPRSRSARILELASSDAGGRLDLFLAGGLEVSRAEARRLLERGHVFLNGRRLSLRDKGTALPDRGKIGVEAFLEPDRRRIAEPEAGGRVPETLAEGPGWLAVDKPAGMPVHPLREGETGTVLNHLATRYPALQGIGEGGLRSGVVHRLDVETSGVLLVATEEHAWERLREAFQRHRVEKVYRALVEGVVSWPSGDLQLEIPLLVARHKPAFVRVARDEEVARGRARVIRQELSVLKPLRSATLVEIRPRTGFLHQIRATLAHLGHPVVGDDHYGAAAGWEGASRPMLHAAHASFEEIAASAAEPEDFRRVLGVLARA